MKNLFRAIFFSINLKINLKLYKQFKTIIFINNLNNNFKQFQIWKFVFSIHFKNITKIYNWKYVSLKLIFPFFILKYVTNFNGIFIMKLSHEFVVTFFTTFCKVRLVHSVIPKLKHKEPLFSAERYDFETEKKFTFFSFMSHEVLNVQRNIQLQIKCFNKFTFFQLKCWLFKMKKNNSHYAFILIFSFSQVFQQ